MQLGTTRVVFDIMENMLEVFLGVVESTKEKEGQASSQGQTRGHPKANRTKQIYVYVPICLSKKN